MRVEELLKKQRTYFNNGKTLMLETRKDLLKKLYQAIKQNENEILEALNQDLGKSDMEAYFCEIGMVLSEITYMLKHIDYFAKEKRVKPSIAQFPAKSMIKPVPYGNVLVMSPWNYPFLLTMEPLVDALAAGNTVIVKPSAYSPSTSKVIEKIISECFNEENAGVVTGGRQANTELLNQKFDLIFFTGSGMVGKEVLRHASQHLTPVVLELGGKSPCIVDESADVELAAKRIVFGKFLNCGQTCIAPDYILCHRSLKNELIKRIKRQIELQFGKEPLLNPDYGKIINEKHFERLTHLINEKVTAGGKIDQESLKIEPTVLDNVEWTDEIMQDEIFGPLLPVLEFDSLDEVIAQIQSRPKPLALYMFTKDKKNEQKVLNRIQFGGGCINDVLTHQASSDMPFGGVGESGMGSYHGKAGFEVFSHHKSIVIAQSWMDLPMRYQPYQRGKFKKLIKFLLK